MGKIIRSQKAKADLVDIWEYVSQEDRDVARNVLRVLNKKIQALTDTPFMGRDRSDDLGVAGVRSLLAGSYSVFYTLRDGKDIVILRIYHAARDLAKVLDE